ncbi:metal-sensitive transcriptional regulator [Camelliibacillus cellulosilyticus]|uniref:Metal-sensitive transcriptional regulator n=1 Tax=Camelliibacillus cellulosilyticus TaxID=2174486 RepID=A0ABV9GNK5_9BACL
MAENHGDLQLQPERKPDVPRSTQEKEKLINRLKRIEGQVRGLQKMVDEDRYCIDILIQLSAVQAALNKVGFSLIERHAKMCVTQAIKENRGDHYIDELLAAVQQFSK